MMGEGKTHEARNKGRMVRKELQVRDLTCICDVAGKFQTWFRAISPYETIISEGNPKTLAVSHVFDDVR